MRNKIILCLFAISSIALLCSNSGGYSANRTGANSTTTGCGSCHGSTSSLGTTIELDSAGSPVTVYRPGIAYTVKITATNNTTATNLSKYGFQLCAVKSTGAGSSSAVQAGTWGTLPTGTQQNGTTLKYIQHSQRLSPTSGTGGAGTVYSISIPWTAPVAGTGSVKVYGLVNAVNANNTDDNGDKYQLASAITITEYVAPVVASVSISETAGTNPTCQGTSVTFTATPTNGGTAPTYQWLDGATAIGTGATLTTSALAAGTHSITCVMTSNLAGVTGNPATSTAISLVVNAPAVDSVHIGASATSFCAGTSVTFTATPYNGGATPAYQWKDGTTNIGTGATLTTSSLAAGSHTITCVMTPSGTCVSPATSTSNAVTVTVNASVTDSVSVSASATSVCAGTSISFTATPTNGGATPAYVWKDGTTNIGTTATLTTSSLTAGTHNITCVMTPSGTCVSPATATSRTIVVTVNPTGTDSVQISASATSLCAGTSVTFTATPFNGGATPGYQWKDGATNIGTGATLTTSSLTAGSHTITCVMTPSGGCVSPATSTSRPITVTVNPSVTDSVSVSASATSACAGTSITFTATPTNGGATPVYVWKDGTTPIGTSATLTTSSLSAGTHNITCVMTPSGTCVSPATATSRTIVVTISAPVAPTITLSGTSTLCTGSPDTIRATVTNGGTNPTYSWTVNGNPGGSNSTTLVIPSVSGNTSVVCTLTSNAACVSPATVASAPFAITISSAVAPTITISAAHDTICAGSSASFTATISGGGSTPGYQWLVGGTPSGTGSTFATASLTDGAVVSCVLTSSLSCANPHSVTSTGITMTVGAMPSPSIVPSGNIHVCAGDSILLTASGGDTYTWSTGQTGTTIYATQSAGYNVTATTKYGCSVALFGGVVVAVSSPAVPVISAAGFTLSSTAAAHYQWLFNNTPMTADTTQSITASANGNYIVVVSDADGCFTPSAAYTVTGVGIQDVAAMNAIRLYPVPNHGSFAVDVQEYNNTALAIYDIYGQEVYRRDISATHTEISDAALSPALYFVQIQSGNLHHTVKMQVVK